MNVVISGTSAGIGRAIAEKFLGAGHAVFGFDIAPSGIKHSAYTHFIHDVRDGASNAHILNDPEKHATVLAETLLGKWAQPEEVADLAFYLTVINRSITGEDILMDNGEQLKSNFIW